MSYAEYLAAEAEADVRHEYLAGDVWAMAGGTIELGGLATAVAREIGLALRGKPCRAFSSDVRVRVAYDRVELASIGTRLGVSAVYANPLGTLARQTAYPRPQTPGRGDVPKQRRQSAIPEGVGRPSVRRVVPGAGLEPARAVKPNGF